MPDLLLIEEAGDRATSRLQSLLTLVLLAFDAGEASARALVATQPRRIIDPVASACFSEARTLLLRPVDGPAPLRGLLFTSMCALDIAAAREPQCYASTHKIVRDLVLEALDEVVELELADTRSEGGSVGELLPGPTCN